MPEHKPAPISGFAAGVAGRCPRCGKGHLFTGFLQVALRCESCGLDFSFAQTGDGPAFFVIFAVSPIVVLLAFITEALFHPAPWMHLVLWIPTVIILCLVLLRPFKGVLVALQYHRQAGESPMRQAPVIMTRRYEVVEQGALWTVGTGTRNLAGYPNSQAAVAAAIEAASDAEKAGEHITIHLWNQGIATEVYATPDDQQS